METRLSGVGPWVGVALLALAGAGLAQHSATRQQWQPRTSVDDARLDQPVKVEILGRAAVPGLELLSKQTGVSLQVAPEDLQTVGERKFTVIAKGCSLKAIMVQLPKALRECHWDVVEGGEAPSYLLHRDGGIQYYGSHEWREAQHWRELRPAREARVAEARQALAMSNGELAELEKTDLLLARSLENPDARALVQLFFSLPADDMEQFLETGTFSMKVEDAPASWKPALEHELARGYAQAVAENSDFSKDLLSDAQARLSQSTVGFEHSDSDGVRIRIAGNIVSPVIWTRYPPAWNSPPKYWYQLLSRPGESDTQGVDALYADWVKRGEKITAEQHDQSLLAARPSLSGWKDLVTIGLDGRHEFLEVEQELSAKTGLSVISDYFTTPPLDIPEAPRGPVLAWHAIDLLTKPWQYQWEKVGHCLVFHRSDWYDLAPCEIPESLVLAYREKLKSQGELTLDDVAALTVAFLKSRVPLLQEIPKTPANLGAPHDLEQAGIWGFNLWSPTLSLYASLSPEQREKVQSPSGLAFSEMTRTQQQFVRQESARYQNPPPPPAEEVPQAVLRLQERPSEPGVHSYKLVLSFPSREFPTPVTLRPGQAVAVR